MGKQERRISYKAGITRTPSDFLCQDGELAECINLTTDTEDTTGHVLTTSGALPDRDAVLAALPRFIGAVSQVPPMVSASRKDGKRLYELARKGIEVERRIITMRDIKAVGEYEATIHFFKEVEVKLPIKVVAENPEELAPAAPVEAPAEVTAEEALEEEIAEALEEEEAPAAE